MADLSVNVSDVSAEDKVKFLSEFIDIYRSLPALWKVKAKIYRNKEIKKQSYAILIKKLREINPAADRKSAVKKINSIRSNFRKEMKKVRSAAEAGLVYAPSLWYYTKLTFLEDQEVKEEEDEDDIPFQSVMISSKIPLDCSPPRASSSASNSSSDFIQPSKRKLEPYDESEENNEDHDPMDDMPMQHQQYEMINLPQLEQDNEYDILGKRLAFQLKGLEEYQKICAEKIIADVIFYAKLGKLTEFSTLQIASLPRQIRPLNINLLNRQINEKKDSSSS